MKPDNTTESINAANTPIVNQMNLSHVLAWLSEQAKLHGLETVTVCKAPTIFSICGAIWYGSRYISETGESFEEVAKKARAKTPNPENLRKQAEELCNEAALLELKELNAQSFTANTLPGNV